MTLNISARHVALSLLKKIALKADGTANAEILLQKAWQSIHTKAFLANIDRTASGDSLGLI